MTASVLFCSLPFLAFARVRESHLATENNLAVSWKGHMRTSPVTGTCPLTGFDSTTTIVQSESTCSTQATQGVLKDLSAITDAATCAAQIQSLCGMTTAPNSVSYISSPTAICVWFSSSCTAITSAASPVQIYTGSGTESYTVSAFTRAEVAAAASNGLSTVPDPNAPVTLANLATSVQQPTDSSGTSLSQSPNQILAASQGEGAEAVASLGAAVGQGQQNCPDSYQDTMARGEWQCIQRPHVGAMMMVCGAGVAVFCVVFALSAGIGYKLRNKDGGEESETMGGEFEEEGEEEEEGQ